MRKLILLLILLNTEFISADTISDSINKLLDQKNCKLNAFTVKKEAKDINKLAGWVKEDKTRLEHKTTQNILTNKILNSGELNCFYRINYTSLYAEVLYKLKDYENALALFKKASNYRELDNDYKQYIKKAILRTKNKIINKESINLSDSLRSTKVKTSTSNQSLIIDDLRFLLANSKKDQEKLMNQITLSVLKVKSLEEQNHALLNKLKAKDDEIRVSSEREDNKKVRVVELRNIIEEQNHALSNKLKAKDNEIRVLSEGEDNKKVREVEFRNTIEGNLDSIFWVMIIGFGTLILMLIFLINKKDLEESSRNTVLPELGTNKELPSAYSKKRN